VSVDYRQARVRRTSNLLLADGARIVLQAAEQKAQQLTAPSSFAVVNPAGELILFEQMQGARPIGIELAIGKARSAALFQLAGPKRSRRRSTPADRRQSPRSVFKCKAVCRSTSATQ
jgi:uncharacterized protein GlcG (DUF336 family)